MLARKSYTRDEVERARRFVAEHLAGDERRRLEALVLALEQLFVHRMRGMEGKGPNALAEVRALCTSIAEGADVGLDAGDVAELASSFLDELEARFVDAG